MSLLLALKSFLTYLGNPGHCFFGSRDPLFRRSRYACMVCTKIRMAAFTLVTLNRTNRAITPELVLIQPKLPNVNKPLQVVADTCGRAIFVDVGGGTTGWRPYSSRTASHCGDGFKILVWEYIWGDRKRLLVCVWVPDTSACVFLCTMFVCMPMSNWPVALIRLMERLCAWCTLALISLRVFSM